MKKTGRKYRKQKTVFSLCVWLVCWLIGCGAPQRETPYTECVTHTISEESISEESISEELILEESISEGPISEGQISEESISEGPISEALISEGPISEESVSEELLGIPKFCGEPYVILNGNIPEFEETEYTTDSFENYSELDELGRCGVAYANIGTDIMPTEERESIGQIKPTGWQLVKYEIVEGNYLYNRCHLIGYQLAGENANEKNLITGTRYMNVSGMLPFENMVADYVRETNHHVLYRVTPIYENDNLVAGGVQMEAWSVEDAGEEICFNVYVYNNQPGIEIDYATGESSIVEIDTDLDSQQMENGHNITYVLNTNTLKFHILSCSSVQDMKPQNKKESNLTREELIEQGYKPCKLCNP